MNYSTISINLLLIVLLISTNCIAEEGLSRAINTSGLWSKYNLISKSNGSSNKGSLSTTLESKYSPMELQDEQDSEESEEEADDEEDEEDEEGKFFIFSYCTYCSKRKILYLGRFLIRCRLNVTQCGHFLDFI